MCVRRVWRALSGWAPVSSAVTVPLADPASASCAITRAYGACERQCVTACHVHMTEDNAPSPLRTCAVSQAPLNQILHVRRHRFGAHVNYQRPRRIDSGAPSGAPC